MAEASLLKLDRLYAGVSRPSSSAQFIVSTRSDRAHLRISAFTSDATGQQNWTQTFSSDEVISMLRASVKRDSDLQSAQQFAIAFEHPTNKQYVHLDDDGTDLKVRSVLRGSDSGSSA